ncbi:hypothetical protein A605_08255 [Corynebacterium halotolerans YIM 70093 = DSM 44683]|uniref:DUF418 domain-containing protein n=1 Tax=Corynebacterium halotolerans YIM 70093 = DSM 44683 TaxID=1121362 RepID=M1NMQ9_9CORY|nr:hypothetical protein A605_08255 [Corynebacterium halotolerans YIM 70093 = DSM 44683]
MPATVGQPRGGQLSAQQRRIIAPDLARGLALLGIALANIATAWTTAEGAERAVSLGGVYDGSALDRAAAVFSAMFVHVRGLPMFSTLLGFGVGLITMSLWRRAYPRSTARWVLVRRYGLLAAFGALHMVLLFFGDIMVLYGLSGIVLALLMPLRDRTLMWIAGVLLGLQFIGFTAMGVVSVIFPEAGAAADTQLPVAESYGGWVLNNLLVLLLAPVSFIPQALTLIPVMIIGFVWARRGVLIDPDAHARLLWRWVWVGAAVVLLIGLPRGLAEIGVIAPGSTGLWSMLNTSFGLLTGPAIVAGVTLACRGLQRRIDDAHADGRGARLSPPLVALTALGKRSMSGYILQSLLFVILVLPFGFGLGQNEGAFQLLIWATVVWLITLAAAYGLELAGKPGPFEWVHRRLSYGRDGLRERYAPTAGQPMPLPPRQPGPPENPHRRG